MSIVNTFSLQSNRQIKINFDGGDLSLLFTPFTVTWSKSIPNHLR